MSPRGAVYSMKTSGPSAEPWGTPNLSRASLDDLLQTNEHTVGGLFILTSQGLSTRWQRHRVLRWARMGLLGRSETTRALCELFRGGVGDVAGECRGRWCETPPDSHTFPINIVKGVAPSAIASRERLSPVHLQGTPSPYRDRKGVHVHVGH